MSMQCLFARHNMCNTQIMQYNTMQYTRVAKYISLHECNIMMCKIEQIKAILETLQILLHFHIIYKRELHKYIALSNENITLEKLDLEEVNN